MTNKEKRKYISDILISNSIPFTNEISKRGIILSRIPESLYKYRSFDKYTFDMIENNYVFLAPVSGLDDPFDCLNDFEIDRFYDKKNNKITHKAIDFILKRFPTGLSGLSKKELKNLAIKCIDENGIDYDTAPKIVKSSSVTTTIEVAPLFIALKAFNDFFKEIYDSTEMNGFAEKAYNPGEKVGVCSLSEKRDNKVMWSLYGKNYSGYCIEYKIPLIKEVIQNLCPVIYTKKPNNSFIEKITEYSMAATLRAITNGNICGNIGATMELFCTKDTDWSYQSEWRIIGNARTKFKHLKIKSIYLGFKVNKTNERNMKKLAQNYNFNLYKMNPPNGSKKITYKKII